MKRLLTKRMLILLCALTLVCALAATLTRRDDGTAGRGEEAVAAFSVAAQSAPPADAPTGGEALPESTAFIEGLTDAMTLSPMAPSPAPDENIFWAESAKSPAPTSAPAPSGFVIEVLERQSPAPAKRVLIYHTHTYEAYRQVADNPYAETEKWRSADPQHNVVRVGAELAALLRALGMDVTHDATAFEPPSLSGAYARSLEMLEKRAAAGERYDLYIDLHRDAYTASQAAANTVSVGGVQVARLMLLIGKGTGQTEEGFGERPEWEKNLAVAQAITDALNEQADGICKKVMVKTGRFNQHIATGCVLVEAGNNSNTLDEALAAMPYLADAIAGLEE